MYTKRIRHTVTKSPLTKPLLAWLYHQGIKPSDIFVASYPRAGSTWLRFLLYELLTGETTSFEAVNQGIPGIGRQFNAPKLINDTRLIQTHEPYRKEYGRAVYLVRDVRDVVVSEFYFQKLWQLYDGDFQEFFGRFLAGQVNRYGSWVDHTNSWLDARESRPDDILLIRFDELRQNTGTTAAKVLTFIGAHPDNARIERAIANNTTARMHEKESAIKFADENLNFVRKGKVGGWQESLTIEQIRQIELEAGPTLQRVGYAVRPADSTYPTQNRSSA